MVSDLIEKINQMNNRGEIVLSDIDNIKDTLNLFESTIESLNSIMQKIIEKADASNKKV
jgi:hypothetical protein